MKIGNTLERLKILGNQQAQHKKNLAKDLLTFSIKILNLRAPMYLLKPDHPQA